MAPQDVPFSSVHPQESDLSEMFPGLLDQDSTTGVEADEAETFSNLVIDPDHVVSRMMADRVLAAKVERR